MRIIAGSLRGRQFMSPRGHRTHPMSDKMRGALFNTLGDIGGLEVLDAFAGSGALAFEAVSRGAAGATVLDSDRQAQQTIATNISNLGLQNRIGLIKASANAWLTTSGQDFDIVLCDPPYNNPQIPLLIKLAGRTRPGGMAVFSLPPDLKPDPGDNYELLAAKSYGDSQLAFYRRIA